ncbi:unnamed protein product [Enterobius vermicularis]|uniref:Pept_C1 domain-containing protein n=1 Tax=Enterobius vermicularis TaxID=51028 RepID=A0A0N4UV40_ENTVE|nr:unnamed protein product [Enterobius vermicularis]
MKHKVVILKSLSNLLKGNIVNYVITHTVYLELPTFNSTSETLFLILRFNRSYKTSYEISARYENFVKTLNLINGYRGSQNTAVLGINEFADWSQSELNFKILNCIISILQYQRTQTTSGKCGSCWAFATVAVVESAIAIHNNQTPVSLSEQQLVDCDFKDSGCNGGYRPYAFEYVRDEGLVSAEQYPYTAEENPQCLIEGGQYRIKDVKYISRNSEAIADFVFSEGPVSVGNAIKLFHYQSGIFDPAEIDCTNNSQGSHAVAIVGFGTTDNKDYWIIKNSWGKRYENSSLF